MHWNKITFASQPDALPELEALLWDLGSVSVTVTDSEDHPIYEPGPGETPLWSNLEVAGLFEEDIEVEIVKRQILGAGYRLLLTEEIGDRPWEREWLSRFHAVKFGTHLWVCPTGEEVTEVR